MSVSSHYREVSVRKPNLLYSSEYGSRRLLISITSLSIIGVLTLSPALMLEIVRSFYRYKRTANILMLIIVVVQIYLYIYRVFTAGRKGLVNVTCDAVNPTNPPSTTIETTSGAISSQTTDIFATTHVIIENNSNKTSEVSTQVIETTNNGNPITIYLSRIWFQ